MKEIHEFFSNELGGQQISHGYIYKLPPIGDVDRFLRWTEHAGFSLVVAVVTKESGMTSWRTSYTVMTVDTIPEARSLLELIQT